MIYVTLVDGRTFVYEDTEAVWAKTGSTDFRTSRAATLEGGDSIWLDGNWYQIAHLRRVRTQEEIDHEQALLKERCNADHG